MNIRRQDISKIVWSASGQGEHRATIATYLFALGPSLYYGHTIELSIKEFIVKEERPRKYVSFKLNGVERLCPITSQEEEHMLRNFVNFDYVESDKFTFPIKGKVGGSYKTICKQIHADAIKILGKLEIPINDEKTVIKLLRDVRIADLIINRDIDYGFLKLKSLCFKRQHMYEKSILKAEIDKYMLSDMIKHSEKIGIG